MSDFIDMSEHVDAVQRKYPDYYRNAQAHAEMADLWGGVSCNTCGVIQATEEITIELQGQSRWTARIWLAAVPNDRWLMSTGHYYPSGGGSGPISIWDRRAYLDREAAFAAGIAELTNRYQRLRDWSGTSHTEKLQAERMIDLLATYTTKPKQMNLF